MMRRSSRLLSGGMVEYHEWHLHEPLLQNYEGWRILDNPKYEQKSDAYIYDFMGSVRHLDPIIDDPRLTHKQRVCRLYRWSLKEIQMWMIQLNAHKFNLAYKVIRRRFEKYRYVTDPATCDMMVRQTQKYLRDNANFHYMRRNNSSPWSTFTLANPMFHPDNSLVYDHWTHPEVMWYDDAKLHRWTAHHPSYAGPGEASERFGDMDVAPHLRGFVWVIFMSLFAWCFYQLLGGPGMRDDRHFEEWAKQFEENLAGALYAEERNSRSRSSVLRGDWDRIMGLVSPPAGYYRNNMSAVDTANYPPR
ncbi:hypothetical protein GH5_03239 [Leishmania sp. Ghana 2012 LV757]|uniref:NADH dehydrogenase [ubiquinone] 1 beta subcomplex subunit 9 n=1 Tax=Leishmania orientalis TaxID=2249476 RepID=A0A836KBE9_9TRYP|nr:hypothetical protein LSCM4_02948 [Leishmania orientalis]KAG5495576.1 hypothetical protein GH5_03239 [Leishmania sp. Ghana 2012 LV757]